MFDKLDTLDTATTKTLTVKNILYINGPSRIGKSTALHHLMDKYPGVNTISSSRALYCHYSIATTPMCLEVINGSYIGAVNAGDDPYADITNLIALNEDQIIDTYEECKKREQFTRKEVIGFAELFRATDVAYWVKAAARILDAKVKLKGLTELDLLWVECINAPESELLIFTCENLFPGAKTHKVSLDCLNPYEVVENDSRVGGIFDEKITYRLEDSKLVAEQLYRMCTK